MYAVIHTGGKQYRVQSGQRLEVELLGVATETEVALRPVLLVDGDTVIASPSQLAKASVKASVRVERWNKRAPNSVSKALIWRLIADFDRPSRSAASVKDLVSATLTKASRADIRSIIISLIVAL